MGLQGVSRDWVVVVMVRVDVAVVVVIPVPGKFTLGGIKPGGVNVATAPCGGILQLRATT